MGLTNDYRATVSYIDLFGFDQSSYSVANNKYFFSLFYCTIQTTKWFLATLKIKKFRPRNLRQNCGLFYLTHYFGFPLQKKKETLGIVPTRSKQTLGAKTISLHLNFLFLLIITFNKIKATTILLQLPKSKQSQFVPKPIQTYFVSHNPKVKFILLQIGQSWNFDNF